MGRLTRSPPSHPPRHAALCTLGTWAITQHSHAWLRHRELFLFAGCAASFLAAAHMAGGGMHFLAHHKNSSFRLLVQLLCANTAFWQLATALLCRAVFRRMVLMQLPLALTAVGGRARRRAAGRSGGRAHMAHRQCAVHRTRRRAAPLACLPAAAMERAAVP